MTDFLEPLSFLIHGEPGAGKSWLGQTTPAPRLVLDAEGGARKARRIDENGRARRIPSILWDPHSEPVPELGEWESCIVTVRRYETMERVYEVLNAGEHPFESVVFDSLTEIQKRCKDSIRAAADTDEMSERLWGRLLDRMELLVRYYRDLTLHPVKPLKVLCILALTVEKNFKNKPAVQGALGVSLPGYVDVVGYLAPGVDETTGERAQHLLITHHDRYEAKDRTHFLSAHFGSFVVNPNIAEMFTAYNTEEAADG